MKASKIAFLLRAIEILVGQLGGAAWAFGLRDYVKGVVEREGDITPEDEAELERIATSHINRLLKAIQEKAVQA